MAGGSLVVLSFLANNGTIWDNINGALWFWLPRSGRQKWMDNRIRRLKTRCACICEME
jgi:hypothetical protein